MKKRFLGKNGCWLAAGGCVLLVMGMLSGLLWAEETSGKNNLPTSALADSVQKEVVIQKKTPDSILAGDHRFPVAAGDVVMVGGEALPLGGLPVPCKAKIYYMPNRMMDPTILRIEVISFGMNAKTAWAPSVPE